MVIKRLIFFALIFSLPFQLGYHFWPPQSFISSFRIDYLSPTIYLVDLLILCYVIPRLCLIRFKPLFLVLVIINLWVAKGNPVTFFAWFRLLEYYSLFQVLRSETNLINKVRKPFLISLGLILILALLQFIRQSSIGGPFYYFGERLLSVFLPNIAKINLPWAQVLRPYSTFSHPNSLAGYLLISLIFLPLFTHSKILKYITCIVILLTFSKSAIISLVIIVFLRLSLSQSLILGFLFSFTVLLNPAANFPSWIRQSFISRHYLIPPTLQVFKNHWLAGVGLRQFIPALPAYLPGNQLSYVTLQPVHNTFLLLVAEVGVAGLLIFYRLVSKKISSLLNEPNSGKYLLKVLTVILLTGSLDHYWWTLPQNQLIIVLALALLSNMPNTSNSTNKSN